MTTDAAEEHSEQLKFFVKKLQDYGLTICETKSIFSVSMLELLGHKSSNAEIALLPNKVVAMQNVPQPTKLHKVREFQGIVNFYRRLIPSCAEIARPLTDVLALHAKNENIEYYDTQIKHFKRSSLC